MAKENKTRKTHSREWHYAKRKRNVVAEPTRSQPDLDQLADKLVGTADNGSIAAQLTRLSDSGFQQAQREAMTLQMERVQGNQNVQTALAQLRRAAAPPSHQLTGSVDQAIQRENGEEAAEGASVQYVHHDVQLVPQTTTMSCWAASAAMLVSWRDQISISPETIAAGAGYWTQYFGGLDPEDLHMFDTWGLTEEEPQTFTIQAFADMLEQYGPLWTAGASGAGAHVRVVTGISGDGTPDGTFLAIHDPAPVNSGTPDVIESYSQYMGIQEQLAVRELPRYQRPIYVAHN